MISLIVAALLFLSLTACTEPDIDSADIETDITAVIRKGDRMGTFLNLGAGSKAIIDK